MKYQPVSHLNIFLNFDEKPILVGQLILRGRQIWFEYDPSFILNRLELSPLKLPLKLGPILCEDRIFEGLFGLFNDSLPDGWGRLLLDRKVRSHGIPAEQLTPLDRLAHVGEYGMGALSYKPQIEAQNTQEEFLKLDQLAEESRLVLEKDSDIFFEDLLRLNGSSSGARPKIVAAVSKDKQKIRNAHSILPEGYEHWIIKFPTSVDANDIAAIELAYNNMAKKAGILTTESYLFPARAGPGYFASKRFDRQQNKRIHMHTLSGLIHADHRIPNLDYETFLKVTYLLTKDIAEVKKAYELAVFNVLSHNRDDHSKNFSFLMDAQGQWKLSPAYDLTHSYGPMGEQSMTVMGEGKNPGIKHLLELGEKFKITAAKEHIETIRSHIRQWPSFAEEAGVSRASKERIDRILRKIIGQKM